MAFIDHLDGDCRTVILGDGGSLRLGSNCTDRSLNNLRLAIKHRYPCYILQDNEVVLNAIVAEQDVVISVNDVDDRLVLSFANNPALLSLLKSHPEYDNLHRIAQTSFVNNLIVWYALNRGENEIAGLLLA